MYEDLLDRWLYESEGDSIDFKRDQYKFSGATEKEKSELLKDILAMSNSWRRIDAFILIGIEDRPEKPNTLIGITEHLDDADLQQFVNSKVNGSCMFEYSTATREGKTIGIIRIPVQKRPVYLTQNYGKLIANTVYVRRGSSTDIAKPDEISKMGLDFSDLKPLLVLGFCDKTNNEIQGPVREVKTMFINIIDTIPEYHERVATMMPTVQNNSNYYKDLVDCLNFKYSYNPFHFAIKNIGDKEAVNIRLELGFLSSNVDILVDGEEIEQPGKVTYLPVLKHSDIESSYSYDKLDKEIRVYNSLERLHAKRTMVLEGIIYLQIKFQGKLTLKAKVFFDGQQKPHEQELVINNEYNQKDITWKDFHDKILK